MHTPEQAKELWCPMVRAERGETVRIQYASIGEITSVHEERHIVGGCNTDALSGTRAPVACRCISTKCAMWRWATTGNYEHDCAIIGTNLGEPFTPTGYCGLAPLHQTA